MAKPTLIAEFKFPESSPKAPGAVVLRDLGIAEPRRFATHWRNDQVGGFGNGIYRDALDEAHADFRKRIATELATRSVSGLPTGPFTWEVWGTHKNERNDDCWTGDTVESLERAFAGMDLWQDRENVAYSCIETPAGRIYERLNPNHVPFVDDRELDLSEAAGQHGMAFGVEGRNEVLGEDVEESGPRFR